MIRLTDRSDIDTDSPTSRDLFDDLAGLRIRKGCSYHGLALNVAMDLEPFARINPCGDENLAVTQISELGGPGDLEEVAGVLGPRLQNHLTN